ncbi:MAG: AsmA family protein [Thermodesulfobacteriota bacterium]
MRNKILIALAALAAVVIVVAAAILAYAAAYDYNKLKPEIEQAVFDATGRKLVIAGDIKLALGLRPALTVEGVSLANAPWGSQPFMARIANLGVRLSLWPLLSGRVDIRELALTEPDILLETDKQGRANFDFSAEAPQKTEKGQQPSGGGLLEKLSIRSMRLAKARIAFVDGAANRSYRLALDEVREKYEGGTISWDLRGAYNGEAFRLTAETGPLADLVKKGQPWPVKAKAEFAGASAGLDGSVTDAFREPKLRASLSAEAKSPDTLLRAAGLEASLPGPLSLSLTLADKGLKVYQADNLALRMGESDLSGSLGADFTGRRPRVRAELASNNLDLRSLAAKEEKHPARSGKTRLFPESPLPVSVLEKMDADLSFQAKTLGLPGLVMRDTALRLTLKNGALDIPGLSGGLFGGTLEARMAARPEASSLRANLNLDIKRLDLGVMLRDLGSQGKLAGKVDFSADLSGAGSSPAAIMAGLDGKMILNGDHASIGSKYMGLLGEDFANSLVRLLNPLKKKSDETPVNCMVLGFAIKNGRARTSAMLLDLPQSLVVGEGEINLATEAIDVSVKSIPKEGVGASGVGKITMTLGKLAEPFKLSGTLVHPTLAVDVSETALLVGKSLGGMALFGPAGVLTALVGTNQEGKDPCRTALEAAEKGRVSSGEGEGVLEKSAGAVEKGVKSLGRGIGHLFGR